MGLNSSIGTHFLQIPGPSPVPERILRAIDRQVIDHRGPEFQHLGTEVLEGCRTVFGTSQPVIIYPSSGTGGWEAAIANTLSPGDRVLMVETGQFAALWRNLATRWGIDVQFLPVTGGMASTLPTLKCGWLKIKAIQSKRSWSFTMRLRRARCPTSRQFGARSIRQAIPHF